MSAGRLYTDRDAATAAWLRRARAAGLLDVLGGGWWRVRGIGRGWRPIQGRVALAGLLERCGQLRPDGAGWALAAELPPHRDPATRPRPAETGGRP